MSTSIQRRYQLFGAFIGLAFSALLFFTVPAYHSFVVWSWTTPAMYVLGIAAFIASKALSKRLA